MSATEGFFVLDLENSVGDKGKVEITTKGSSGSGARQRLGNISNLPQRPKPSTQDEKLQIITTSKEYVDQLQKENMALMKLLADRNKIIELSGVELQKLRVNLQKMQQQNWHLAQTNSQMLVELNSGKDRLKALHHELGCKNSLLKSKKIELEKAKTRKCQKIECQVETTRCEEESSQANGDYNKPCNTNRKQRSKSLGPSTTKQVQAKEKAENKRLCLRRQSARFKSEEPEHTEDLFEPTTKQVQAKEKAENKRQSARFKSEEPEHTEDLFELDDAEFPTSSMSSSVKKEDEEGNTVPRDEAEEFRRSSIGRPSRLAAKKIHSYKEIPLNVKMRRIE